MSAALMVAVDCSECGGRAIEYAAKHARESGARLYVTHIIEWSQYSFSTVQENAERHKRRRSPDHRLRWSGRNPRARQRLYVILHRYGDDQ